MFHPVARTPTLFVCRRLGTIDFLSDEFQRERVVSALPITTCLADLMTCLQRFFLVMLIFMAVMLLICLGVIYISYSPTTWPLVAKYGKLMDSQDSILRAFAAFTCITCALFVAAQTSFYVGSERCCNNCLSVGQLQGCCVTTATFYQTNATCGYCHQGWYG